MPDPDIEALLDLLAESCGATTLIASLHRPDGAPALLGRIANPSTPVGDYIAMLNRRMRFERRRKGDHDRIDIAAADADGCEIWLSAYCFPLHRDAHVLIALDAPSGIEPLLKWVETSLSLWWRRRCEAEWNYGLRTTLDLIDLGVIVVNGEGAIHFANSRAQHLLDVGDGIRRFGEALSSTTFDDAVRLQTAIGLARQYCGTAGSAPWLTLRRSKGRPIVAAVSPIARPQGYLCDPAVIVYLLDPDSDVEHLLVPVCESYRLTGAETQLAKLLVGGQPLAAAAARLRIRPDTARSYLKQIFAKTGTHRQAELVRVMLSSLLRAGGGNPLNRSAIFRAAGDARHASTLV